MPLWGEKGSQVPRCRRSERWVPMGALLWEAASKGPSPAMRHWGK